MTEHSGRLELTWTNKDKRLLADEDGSYVWVHSGDHRVAEVRLLDDAGVAGESPNQKFVTFTNQEGKKFTLRTDEVHEVAEE